MWVASRPHPLPLPARYSNTKVLIAPQAPHTHSAWLPHTLMLKRLPSTPSPVFILTSPSVLLKFRLGVSSIRKEAFPASISPLDFAVYSFPHASECPCICDPSFNSVCELEVWFNYWSWFTWLSDWHIQWTPHLSPWPAEAPLASYPQYSQGSFIPKMMSGPSPPMPTAENPPAFPPCSTYQPTGWCQLDWPIDEDQYLNQEPNYLRSW